MHVTTKIIIGLLVAILAIEVFTLVLLLMPNTSPTKQSLNMPLPPSSPPSTPNDQPGSENRPTDGPWTRDLHFRWSKDGSTFSEAKTFVERSGVPSVIQDANGRLIAVFQWFPEKNVEAFDKIAVMFSDDVGITWTKPKLIVVNGATWTSLQPSQQIKAGSYTRPYDPTIVQLADGRFRLYFTSNPTGNKDRIIYSAISDDAITYTLEAGERMNTADDVNYDVAVLLLGDTWHLTTPGPGGPGKAHHATSSDGLTFVEQALIGGDKSFNWTGNLVAYDKGMRFYGSSRNGLWWAYSKDGKDWTNPTLIQGGGSQGGDPTVVQVADDRFLMIYVSEKVR